MFKRITTTTPISNLVSQPVSTTKLVSGTQFVGATQPIAQPVSSFASSNLVSNVNLAALNPSLISQIGTQVIKPGLLIDPSLINVIGKIPTLPVTPPGMPQTLSPTELQILLNSLPVAQEGTIITSAFFNSLRTAILALAAQIGGGAISPTQLINFLPAFTVTQQSPAWMLDDGIASAPAKAGGGSASGWLPLQLPDNLTIQAMTVLGDKSGTITSFVVELFKRSLDGSDAQGVITTSLAKAADQFNVTTQASGTPPVVDNRSTGYFVSADVTYTGDASQARIFAIQVICSR